MRNGRDRVVSELQLHILKLEKLLILPDQGVFRLREDVHQCRMVQFGEGTDYGKAADELRDQPELYEIPRLGYLQDVGWRRGLALLSVLLRYNEAKTLFSNAALDDLVQPHKSAAADKQDVRRVDLDEFLMRMLAPSLW